MANSTDTEVLEFNFLFNKGTFFFLQGPIYRISATSLRKNPLYSILYIVVGNFVFMNLLPMVILSVLNYLVFKIVAR